MNNLDQSLNYPTMTGLKSLELNELTTIDLTTIDFKANTIDGDVIYYNRIEGNEIIVDTRLTLTNTGVISVGEKFISDIELTYLDGVTSNIQEQINNISDQEYNFQYQITNLQYSDISQNILLGIHTNELEYLKLSDISQNNLLLSYGTQITNLQRSDISQNTLLLNLQSSDKL